MKEFIFYIFEQLVYRRCGCIYILPLLFLPFNNELFGQEKINGRNPFDAESLVLRGNYEYNSFILSSPNFNDKMKQGHFRIWISWPKWSIVYTNLCALTNPYVLYLTEASHCDGENVVVIRQSNPLNMKMRGGQNAIDRTGNIYPGRIPPFFEKDTYNMWVMLLTAIEWKNTNGVMPGPDISDISMFYTPETYIPFHFIEEPTLEIKRLLVFHKPGRFMGRNIKNNGKMEYFQLLPPYNNGFTLAEMRWYSTTNVGIYCLPIHADFHRYYTQDGATSKFQLRTSYIARINVTNVLVRVDSEYGNILGKTESALIHDHRFIKMNVPAVPYMVTNSIPSVNNSKLKALAQRMRKQALEAYALEAMGFKNVSIIKKCIVLLSWILICVLIGFPIFKLVNDGVLPKQKKKYNTYEKQNVSNS